MMLIKSCVTKFKDIHENCLTSHDYKINIKLKNNQIKYGLNKYLYNTKNMLYAKLHQSLLL